MNRLSHFLERVPRLICVIFSSYLLLSLLFDLFIDKSINLSFPPNGFSFSNFFPFLLANILLLTFVAITRFFQKESPDPRKKFYCILAVIFFLFFGIQILFTLSLYFYTDWDVGMILSTVKHLATGETDINPNDYYSYFSTYPNNLFFTYTLAVFYRIGTVLFAKSPYFFVLSIFNFLVNITVFLATLCIDKMLNNKAITLISMILGMLFIGLSPWITIPYTDAFCLIFPILALFLYLFVPNPYAKYTLMAFVLMLGYFYKPTVLIMAMALALLKAVLALKKLIRRTFPFKKAALIALCVILALSSAFVLRKAVSSHYDIPIDREQRFTLTHYLMMGLNTSREGVFSVDDVLYSASFSDVSSRQAGNIKVIKERLKTMGVKGFLLLMVKKNLRNYDDGTFTWGGEGRFYAAMKEDRTPLTKPLRDFFCFENKQIFNFIAQTVWFLLLLSAGLCLLPSKKGDDATALIALTLLGVSIFLLLFECRARYLFLFTPLFLILFASGLQRASDFIFRLRKKHQNLS